MPCIVLQWLKRSSVSSCTSNRRPSVSAVVPMLTKVERKMETTAASWIGPSGNFEDTGLIATAEKPLPIHRDELRDVQSAAIYYNAAAWYL